MISHKYCLPCSPPPADTEDIVNSIDIDWDSFFESQSGCDDEMDDPAEGASDDDNVSINNSDDDDV